MTIERYICLKEKSIHTNDKIKKRIILIYIIFIWLLAIGFSLPKALSIVEKSTQINSTQLNFTACDSTFNQTNEEIYTILKWILAFLLPYVVIIFFSCCLLRFLKEWSDRAKLLHNESKKLPSTSSEKASFTADKNKTFNKINATVDDSSENLEPRNSLEISNSPKFKSATNENESLVFNPKSPNCYVKYTTNNNGLELDIMEISPTQNKPVVVKKVCRSSRIKKRTTRFALAIVISFLCAWSPFWIFQIIVTFTEYENYFLKIMQTLTLIGVYMEGITNPLLFLILTQNFREFISTKFKYFKNK